MKVLVAYARPERQEVVPVDAEPGTTVRQAIDASGICSRFPEIDLAVQEVGVFGVRRRLDEHVREGERIEIYRPLAEDPRQARLRRARR